MKFSYFIRMKDERFSGLLITRNLDKRKRDSYNDVLRFLLNFFGEGNKESESDGAQRNVPTLISAMTSKEHIRKLTLNIPLIENY